MPLCGFQASFLDSLWSAPLTKARGAREPLRQLAGHAPQKRKEMGACYKFGGTCALFWRLQSAGSEKDPAVNGLFIPSEKPRLLLAVRTNPAVKQVAALFLKITVVRWQCDRSRHQQAFSTTLMFP
jgi:hypothetical protein